MQTRYDEFRNTSPVGGVQFWLASCSGILSICAPFLLTMCLGCSDSKPPARPVVPDNIPAESPLKGLEPSSGRDSSGVKAKPTNSR